MPDPVNPTVAPAPEIVPDAPDGEGEGGEEGFDFDRLSHQVARAIKRAPDLPHSPAALKRFLVDYMLPILQGAATGMGHLADGVSTAIEMASVAVNATGGDTTGPLVEALVDIRRLVRLLEGALPMTLIPEDHEARVILQTIDNVFTRLGMNEEGEGETVELGGFGADDYVAPEVVEGAPPVVESPPQVVVTNETSEVQQPPSEST